MSHVLKMYRSLRVRVAVSALVLAVTGVTVMARMDARPVTDRAKAWVASHRQVLPQTLEEYAAYPVEYQRAIFEAYTPQDKSRMWRTQLQLVLDHERNLSPAQQAFIRQSIAQATPESFEPLATTPNVCPRVAELFADMKSKRLFNQLGTATTPSSALRPMLVSLTEKIRAKFVTQADAEACNCHGHGFCECGSLSSCMGGNSCTHNMNCGCIWSSECDSVCEFIMQNSPVRVKK